MDIINAFIGAVLGLSVFSIGRYLIDILIKKIKTHYGR